MPGPLSEFLNPGTSPFAFKEVDRMHGITSTLTASTAGSPTGALKLQAAS